MFKRKSSPSDMERKINEIKRKLVVNNPDITFRSM